MDCYKSVTIEVRKKKLISNQMKMIDCKKNVVKRRWSADKMNTIEGRRSWTVR